MKYFLASRIAVISIIILMVVSSCKKEADTTVSTLYTIPSNLKMISSGYALGAATKVEVYSAADLSVGYNQLYIALYDSASNVRITQSKINLTASLQTGATTVQYSPVENPTSTNADKGLFKAAAIFLNTPTNGNQWTLTIHANSDSKKGDFEAVVNVPSSTYPKVFSTAIGGNVLFAALLQPASPQVGINKLELAIYRQIDSDNFSPDSSYAVVISPEMPDMGGMSTPNNVNPVHGGNGHYTGKVNFNMDGYWRIHVHLVSNTTVTDTAHYFDLTF